jgi:hypothetical protein
LNCLCLFQLLLTFSSSHHPPTQGFVDRAWEVVSRSLKLPLEERQFANNFYIYHCSLPLEASLTVLNLITQVSSYFCTVLFQRIVYKNHLIFFFKNIYRRSWLIGSLPFSSSAGSCCVGLRLVAIQPR